MKKDWLLGAAIGLFLTLFLAACAWFEAPFTESLEYKLYDLRLKSSSKDDLSEQILLVAIDDPSIGQIGRWPWPRATQGELLRRVGAGGPKVIGVNIFWLEKDVSPAQDVLGQVKEKYLGLLAAKEPVFKRYRAAALEGELKGFADVFDEAGQTLDQDRQLAEVLSVTPRVVLPLLFSENRPLADENDELLPRMPYQIAKVEAGDPSGRTPLGYTPALPLKDFASDVSGMGFSNVEPDVDGAVRGQPVAFQYRGKYFPALPVEMARLAKGLDVDAVRLQPGRALILGDKTVPLDRDSRILVRYAGLYSTDKNHMVSAVDVLSDKVDPKAFKDKIVLVAPRAAGVDPTFVTPAASITPSVDVQLNTLQNLLGDKFVSRPAWARSLELVSLLLVGLFVVLGLPFLRAKGGALAAFLLLLGMGGTGWYLFLAKGWWIKIFYPMALLALSYTTLTLRRFFFTEKRKELVEAEGIETNKMLGLSFQGQGMLDMAFEKFRRCPVDDQMKELLYNLALDFERKRQFGKAAAAYEHIAAADPSYKDVKKKISSSKQASETMISGPLGRPRDGSATLVSEGAGVKATLGKYEIQKELGRGAMGVVYLGKDPKINRMVAIKTLNIDGDLDEDSVKDVKERFFREAESAGTLNHPNIVKIFDADEDKSTQVSYISMELLDGEDLKKYGDKANLLPPTVVMDYVALIADALDYAHEHGVVHRDIKPANIMKLKDGSIRVTDFGIARITASSKTQTGTVMGTPSYMSPEQVAGKKVDGRADLFSLGVMLYEMLTGDKPFEGDSIATLLFRIASEPHPDPTLKASARVSPACKAVIDKALQKLPENRYQRGSDMARDIREALKSPAGPAVPAPSASATMPLIPPPPPPAPRPVAAAATLPPSVSTLPLRPAAPSAPAAVPPAPPAVQAPPPTALPPRPPAPPAAPPPPRPTMPPLVLPPLDDADFKIVTNAAPPPPPPPAPPKPAAPPPPWSEPTFEIVRNAPPVPAPKPAAPPSPNPGDTVRMPSVPPAPPEKKSDTVQIPPAKMDSDGTQKL